MRKKYEEGMVFAIPLKEGGYSLGVVARIARNGGLLLAYLFGPVRQRVPSLSEVEALSPENAAKVWRIGDTQLVKGKWPVIGILPSWKREKWPVPLFVEVDDLITMTARLVAYEDNYIDW